ncbi:MAG: cyclophilin-like fold protein, partial [Aristaeellaceae bacterium]
WEAYDTVYIGYPIWWGIAAWPVNQFVTGNDFTGKTVIPFCTSADSDLGESDMLLADMAGTGTWLAGRRFTSRAEEDEVLDWVRDMQQAASWQNIVLTFGEQQLHGVLFDNETARLFAQMLPLNVEMWNPAPGFAKAFDLPEAIPDIEPHSHSYELGGLAYWYPGPSVAIFHSDHLEETIVPVVTIGRITDGVGFLADYEGSLSISLAP